MRADTTIMITPRISLTIILIWLTPIVGANTLDAWILERISQDERILRDATLRQNGRDLNLLKPATTYTPFFLETPSFDVSVPEKGLDALSGYLNSHTESFLSGGYIYRIRFAGGESLYALSSGDWDGANWLSPPLKKEIRINPFKVWKGDNDDPYIYASILAEVPPKLVTYNSKGDYELERSFDVSDPNLAAEIARAEEIYASNDQPSIELISLAEYLISSDPTWRDFHHGGRFNFRNQHDRPEEAQHVNIASDFKRATAVTLLEDRLLNDKRAPDDNGADDRPTKIDHGDSSAEKQATPDNPGIIGGGLIAAIVGVFLIASLGIAIVIRRAKA